DLQVTNLVVPSVSPHSGDTITVSFTVTNVGQRDTREKDWRDRIFLSSDPSLDSSDIELDDAARNGILNVGDKYTVTRTMRLSDGISGNYYILVYTDASVGGRLGIAGLAGGGYGSVAEFRDAGT